MAQDDPHALIAELKDLALELGRTPLRTEFENRVKAGKQRIERLFNTYSALLQAAGMETYKERRKSRNDKIDGGVFTTSVERQVERHEESPLRDHPPWPKISTISDIHWPFCSKRVIGKFLDRVEEFQPEWVVLNGDAWDMFSHSKYPRSHNVFTPREEEQSARGMNEEFWADVKRRVPSAKRVQMLGNHDIRPLKRILEAYPSAEDWIETHMRKLFTFDGVKTFFDPREELVIGDIAIFHGYRTALGAHRDYTLMNCINGHTHKGGAAFRQVRGMVLWELNSGMAGDPESKGLTYTPQRITNWTPGFGEVDEIGPRFIPA